MGTRLALRERERFGGPRSGGPAVRQARERSTESPASFARCGRTVGGVTSPVERNHRRPQPLARGDPRLYHYIPQWFLRRFADENDRLVRVTLREPGRPSPPTAVRNVAAIRDFYTVEDDVVGPTVDLERALANLDGEGVKPIERLATASPWFFPPSTVDRALIARFVALQAVRGPKRRRQLEAMADFIAKASLDPSELEVRARQHLAAGGVDDPTAKEVAALTDLSDVELDPGRGFLIQTVLQSADRIVPVLMDRYLAVIKFTEPGLVGWRTRQLPAGHASSRRRRAGQPRSRGCRRSPSPCAMPAPL
jgi:Protein of unknown function (DUF4238)